MPKNHKKPRRDGAPATSDPMVAPLATFKRRDVTGFDGAWVGLEPTFSNKRTVRRWLALVDQEGGEDRFFADKRVLTLQKRVAQAIAREYRSRRKKGDDACPFASVEVHPDHDPWGVRRQTIRFAWGERGVEPFEVRFGLDPETYEFSIKPVPLVWLYDERFVRFLERFIWGAPQAHGLVPSIAHGGGQFSFSAKTFLQGSLLADDIAHRLDHPELATWILDFPNPDDRAFRATQRRADAFRAMLDAYWGGGFHPRAIGTLTVENAYLDRGFEPAASPAPGRVDPVHGPRGDAREVFQTNFAFGRAVRLRAQSVHPGYWQASHPDEDGYRPDQIMRYGEANLNRLQIAGEWHVKSGEVLDDDDVRELDAPLEQAMLYEEASWEMRAQMSRTSARDFVEAVLLEAHHAQWLRDHPHVVVRPSLAQDQLLGDAERTLAKHAQPTLDKLRRRARKDNLADSRGRIKSDWIEPEALFWAAWRHLPPAERAVIAHEAILGFIERVHHAATKDPRGRDREGGVPSDPMEWHRHRIHPLLWQALEGQAGALAHDDHVRREWSAWKERAEEYLARRPMWSPLEDAPPWSRA